MRVNKVVMLTFTMHSTMTRKYQQMCGKSMHGTTLSYNLVSTLTYLHVTTQ